MTVPIRADRKLTDQIPIVTIENGITFASEGFKRFLQKMCNVTERRLLKSLDAIIFNL